MDGTSSTEAPRPPRSKEFKTTHWSVVLSTGDHSDSVAHPALEKLCQAYWYPLYAFVRRQGHSPEDSQDLTQEFFARFLNRGSFAKADPERGRFRTYLLTSIKRFLTEEWRRTHRQKRGGEQIFEPLESEAKERRYAAEPKDTLSPDLLYDRRWAEALLERVLAQLRRDYDSTGRAAVYAQLQRFLWGREEEISYAEMGQRLSLNEGAVKVAVHRLRQRFRDLLNAEVAHTVETPAEIEQELRHLLSMFAP